MNEIIFDVLKDNLNKRVLIFVSNGFRFEGFVLEVNETSVKFKDKRDGLMAISIEDIVSARRLSE